MFDRSGRCYVEKYGEGTWSCGENVATSPSVDQGLVRLEDGVQKFGVAQRTGTGVTTRKMKAREEVKREEASVWGDNWLGSKKAVEDREDSWEGARWKAAWKKVGKFCELMTTESKE